MLLVYVLIVVIALVMFKYICLVLKRLSLIKKLQKATSFPIVFQRNRLASIFFPNGKTDIVLQFDENKHYISIITTPFRRVRYHFVPTQLELIFERRATVLSNYKPGGGWNTRAANYNTSFILKRYNMNPPVEMGDKSFCFYIIHPAPRVLSMLFDNQLRPLDNGDFLYNKVIACGLKWYVEHASDTAFLTSIARRNGEER